MTVSEFTIAQPWNSDRRSPARWILWHVWRHKLYIAGVFVGAFGNAALAAALPVLTGQAFDVVLARPATFRQLGVIAGLIVLSQLVRGVLMMARNFCSEVIGQRLERDAREELYVSLLGKSMSFHDSQSTGDLMARATNDLREMNMMANPGMNLVVGSLNFLLMPLLVSPSIHPQLLLVPIGYTIAYVLSLRQYLLDLRPATERVRHKFGEMNAVLAEAIEGVETVKGAAQEARERDRFAGAVNAWRKAFIVQGDIEARFIPLLLLGLLQALGFLHSLLLFRTGAINVGDVVSFNGLLLLFGFPTFVGQFAYPQVASGLSSARRVLEIINTQTKLDQNVGGYQATIRGAIEFVNLSFNYDGGDGLVRRNGSHPALENVSFRVEPGQRVAIVGQTGSGKSTIIKLINRIYDADSGQVLVDGVDVRDWNLEALRRQISIIEQDIFLLSRTIAENIAFGCPEATPAEIEAAARAAQAHDFILGFKDGYETLVGERGVTLSGGQRQRVALARAFLTDPRILILDDSTSAIDSATEDRIQQAIERIAQNRTTLLITHRLSQIRWADQIVVMRQGRVAAIGTHDDLMRESEAYRNIFTRYESW
ncbi:MAG: ABC transporter ATP-binding protein [Anaerolineae bacterium]